MGRNNYFQFKQFKILQEKSAMKVNTDGVLLGAWVNVEFAQSVVDVGTGTGVIALMLAQRSSAAITAIEIEKNAAQEADLNIQNSKWSNRISVHPVSFQEFAKTTKNAFDLVVSNPPFFSNGVKNQCQNKSLARHNDSLPFSSFIEGSVQILTPKGKLAVILPANQSRQFTEIANANGLYLNRLTEIKPSPLKEANRYLMEFSGNQTTTIKDELTIYSDNGADYTEQYKNLTQDFYLNF